MKATKEMSDAFRQAVGSEIACNKAKRRFQDAVKKDLEDLDFIVAQFAASVEDANKITDPMVQMALNDLLRASDDGMSFDLNGEAPE